MHLTPKYTIIFILATVLLMSCQHDMINICSNYSKDTVFVVTPPVNTSTGTTASDTVCFNTEILPLYVSYCGSAGCHDVASHREGVITTSYGYIMRGIKPKNVSNSEYYTIIGNGMPPRSSPQLTTAHLASIKKWIEQGAVYEPHWAFVVPKKQVIPEVKNKQWPINEIDFFILKKMEEKGLEPNEQASKERLAKRAYMDLVGILPTPQEMQLFVNDTDPKAYEKLVDRLMAQPQYGERMAISWMDIARFSDSH